jgi:hypothetical protein
VPAVSQHKGHRLKQLETFIQLPTAAPTWGSTGHQGWLASVSVQLVPIFIPVPVAELCMHNHFFGIWNVEGYVNWQVHCSIYCFWKWFEVPVSFGQLWFPSPSYLPRLRTCSSVKKYILWVVCTQLFQKFHGKHAISFWQTIHGVKCKTLNLKTEFHKYRLPCLEYSPYLLIAIVDNFIQWVNGYIGKTKFVCVCRPRFIMYVFNVKIKNWQII